MFLPPYHMHNMLKKKVENLKHYCIRSHLNGTSSILEQACISALKTPFVDRSRNFFLLYIACVALGSAN